MNRAFTIVELLVVITIIVILLALLAPAMDQAIYQAELAVCGAKLHAIANGAVTYTQFNKRRWPDRPARRSNGSNRPIDLYFGFNQLHHLDDRLILKQFISINKTLNCPLVKPIDIEGSDPNGFAASPYGLYFGWGYGKKGDKEMLKLGDRWTYTDTGDGSGPPAVNTFSVLASDWDSVYTNNSLNYGTHPDVAGVMTEYHRFNEDYTFATDLNAGPTMATFSYWIATRRPPVDENFAFDDGSVNRVSGVTWNEGVASLGGSEERLKSALQSDNKNQPTWFFRLPGNR